MGGSRRGTGGRGSATWEGKGLSGFATNSRVKTRRRVVQVDHTRVAPTLLCLQPGMCQTAAVPLISNTHLQPPKPQRDGRDSTVAGSREGVTHAGTAERSWGTRRVAVTWFGRVSLSTAGTCKFPSYSPGRFPRGLLLSPCALRTCSSPSTTCLLCPSKRQTESSCVCVCHPFVV